MMLHPSCIGVLASTMLQGAVVRLGLTVISGSLSWYLAGNQPGRVFKWDAPELQRTIQRAGEDSIMG